MNFTDVKILDEGRIQEIGNSLLDICTHAKNAAKRLVVDFRGVQFMSSAMIGNDTSIGATPETRINLRPHNQGTRI